jgi:hypothetical protein
LVGVLDPFWDTKGYVDGKEYSRFCNATVPLVRFSKMLWLNNETLKAPIELSHFGDKPLPGARITWSITDAKKNVLKQGAFTRDLPLDNCIPVGEIDFPLQGIEQATALTVSVDVEQEAAHNQWNIWVYPAQKPKIEGSPMIVSKLDGAALDCLAKGGKVLLMAPKGSVLPKKGGDIAVGFSSIFWNTAWTAGQAPHTLGILCDPQHPVFAAFPNEGYSDYQWWDLMSNCDAMILNDFPAGFRPLVHLIDDWATNRKLGLLFEAQVGGGKLMVCSSRLTDPSIYRPAALQFMQSILEYMASDKFNPQQQLPPELIKGLFQPFI